MTDREAGEYAGPRIPPEAQRAERLEPAAAPEDNGRMPDAEFQAWASAQVGALLEQLGVEIQAQVWLETDQYGCIRVQAKPVLVRLGEPGGL